MNMLYVGTSFMHLLTWVIYYRARWVIFHFVMAGVILVVYTLAVIVSLFSQDYFLALMHGAFVVLWVWLIVRKLPKKRRRRKRSLGLRVAQVGQRLRIVPAPA